MILRLNSVGADVGSLQQRLFTQGFKIERTNVYDERTEAVIRQTQARAGLVVDGIYGPKTEAYLKGSETGVYMKQSNLVAAAQKLGVDLASVMAVNEVESTGTGFIELGMPRILFERHVFWRRLVVYDVDPKPLALKFPGVVSQQRGGYAGGRSEYTRLAVAVEIHADAAYEACSWGAFQIMGYHAKALGFESVREFVAYMRESEGNHLDAFVRFILADPSLHRALVGRKWATFARLYNGPAYADNLYDVKLARAFKRYEQWIKDAS
ncbi:N-acetylmuramidase family protein [Alcaligenes sp. 13f]|uniref:N-acetylmuramidase domain-containing protein n=1 Tax=Alcaligenes sp. 13f TaxID=2841924 RepID=UPI001CF68D61|nr:N-acetylmuramidase family protein [Alcaligenes sp. 13f]MCB4324491.1 N-acetylmuramidase family protein [Alcaligenes sp. 13f]